MRRWQQIREIFTLSDASFLALRCAAVLGGGIWILLAPLSQAEQAGLLKALLVFSAYGFLLYVLILLRPDRIRYFYLLSLAFDLLFVSWLVTFSNRFDNSFFFDYYLLVALHSFYFGYPVGLFVVSLAAALYVSNVLPFRAHIHWTDFALRVAFLYLTALPLGPISGKLMRDKERIEKLNARLSESLARLQDMQAKLVESEKLSAIGRLTADIAHEIRNPAAALGGLSRQLSGRLGEGAKEKEYAETIVSEVARLETILRDILLLTKTGKGLTRGDVNEPVRRAIGFFCELYQANQRTSIIDEYAPELPRVYLDEEQVRQAVGNLICNAVEAMPHGGTVTVRTGTEFTNEILWVTITVRDTGKGIPKDKLAVIFEPFFSTKRIGPGTGLGLAIVRRIMEDHRGFVRVKSEEGKGAMFTLYFPYQPEEEDARTPCWERIGCGIERIRRGAVRPIPISGESAGP